MKLTVVLKPTPQGGFKAHVPRLRIYTGGGKYEREALENVRSAILLHLGIEETVHPINSSNWAYYKDRLKEIILGKMSLEKNKPHSLL